MEKETSESQENPKSERPGCGTLILVIIGAGILSKFLPEEEGKVVIGIFVGIPLGLYLLYYFGVIAFSSLQGVWGFIKGDSVSEVTSNIVTFVKWLVIIFVILFVGSLIFPRSCTSDYSSYEEAVPANARR